MTSDNIFATKREITPFEFNDEVVRVFEDMIGRSVPYYRDNLKQIVRMAIDSAQEGSNIYDLGCSLGACLLPLANEFQRRNITCIGIDNSEAMITELQRRPGAQHARIIKGDIQDLEIENASVVILNYTLQFIPVELRNDLIARIAKGTRPGGILLLSEKFTGSTDAIDEFLIEYHHEFKKRNGYSDLEIAQKRQALENVMITETIPEHFARFERAGFSEYCVWQQYFNFASLYARK